MNIPLKKINAEILEKGYFVFEQKNLNYNNLCDQAKEFCNDYEYKRGKLGIYRSEDFQNKQLLNLVVNENLIKLFKNYDCKPQDIFITHESKVNEITRNNYLHFDRQRCLKVLVYLEDVCSDSGPFTIAKNTAHIGEQLRLSFRNVSNYKSKKNRIDLDYPEIKYELFPITGKAGTTIIFDTDLFHMGGNITKQGKTRTIIRSHWFKDREWRISSTRKF